jgi:hypothetical protein
MSVFLWDKIFKKSIIDKYGIRFPEKDGWEDSLFFYEYVVVAKDFHILSDKLYNYTMRGNTSMWNSYKAKRKHMWDSVRMGERLAEFLKKNNLMEEKAAALCDVVHRNMGWLRYENFVTKREFKHILRRINYMLKETPFVFSLEASELVYKKASPVRRLLRKLMRKPADFDDFVARIDRRRSGD